MSDPRPDPIPTSLSRSLLCVLGVVAVGGLSAAGHPAAEARAAPSPFGDVAGQQAAGTSDAEPPPGAAAPRDAVDDFLRRWTDLLARRDSLGEEEFSRRSAGLLEEFVALEALAPALLPERWEELTPRQRRDFGDALLSSLRSLLLSPVAGGSSGGYPAVEAAGGGEARGEPAGGEVELQYRVRGPGEEGELTLHLTRNGDGSWALRDAEYDGDRLTDHYRERVEDLLDDYSFPYMVAVIGDRDAMVVEDFEDEVVGELPKGWHWRDRDEDEHKPYEVREEDGNKYLAARDEGESVSLGKDVEWDLEEYPYISFRVRVHEIPEGADERYDETVDSAAGVYVVYDRKAFGLIPVSVKYVWSSTLPVGAATQRRGVGKPWQVVVASGEEGLGEWHTFVFDLRETYRDTFGGDPPDKPLGVAVLSDANAVGGRAYADYDDIRLLRSVDPEPGSGVRERLRP